MIKEIDIIELISFLNLHYVEDDKFKLCYSEENIKWSISDGKIYGYYFKNKLIGTIAFNKIKLNINNTINDYYEINFLCCHTEYRHNGIAKKLIDHVIFDAIANKIYFGFFTGGTFHKKYNYISLLNYYHHPINVKKLYECDFINLINDISFTEEYYKINNIILPKITHINNNINLIKYAYNIYNNFISKQYLLMYEIISLEQFINIYYNNTSFSLYLIDNNQKIDIVSYYVLHNKCIKNNEIINNAYIYHFTTNNGIKYIYEILLIIAKINNIDVISFLDMFQLNDIIENQEIRIFKGTGKLYYGILSVENIKVNKIKSNKIYKMIL